MKTTNTEAAKILSDILSHLSGKPAEFRSPKEIEEQRRARLEKECERTKRELERKRLEFEASQPAPRQVAQASISDLLNL